MRMSNKTEDNSASHPRESKESERVNGRRAWRFTEKLCEREREEKGVKARWREQVELMEPAKTLTLIDSYGACAACAPVTCSPERRERFSSTRTDPTDSIAPSLDRGSQRSALHYHLLVGLNGAPAELEGPSLTVRAVYNQEMTSERSRGPF